MKITRLEIVNWRGFSNIVIDVPKGATLVALIGENGVGKSSILDVVNSAAHRLGLSSGVDIPRGDPFNETHEINVSVDLGNSIHQIAPPELLESLKQNGIINPQNLTLKSSSSGGQQIYLTESPNHQMGPQIVQMMIERLRLAAETFHLSLDADRAYPPQMIQAHEYGQSLDNDWDSAGHRKHRAFASSRSKYEEWLKYLVGTEAKKATEFTQATRLAHLKGEERPKFEDQFLNYGSSVKSVLPHLQFLGVDTKSKSILFDSMGTPITFNKLSGGEREIAFVIGQIERFGLRNGLLLIDEPELHLNPEMIRTWISYLRDTVTEGQTWIATHSMEAVEAAGLECSFVVQRTPETRKVSEVASLADRPALSVLSAAIGSPAFSIAQKRFIFIEGDRSGAERDKFFRLIDLVKVDKNYRFMEGGGCKEIVRKVDACRMLSEDQGGLHIGGIVDRDHRTEEEILELTKAGLFILPFHEIENAFIHPAALEILRRRASLTESATSLILRMSDKRAGRWIFGRACYRSDAKFQNHRAISEIWSNSSWIDLQGKNLTAIGNIPPIAESKAIDRYEHELSMAFRDYQEIREKNDLWLHVEGKQLLTLLSNELGFSRQIAHINNICTIFKENRENIPQQIMSIVEYIDSI